MPQHLSYRHRTITGEDLVFIRSLIAAHPTSSRWDLSKKLCVAWNWVQPNGTLRDMVCRGMMLMLDRAGLIELPSVRQAPRQHNGKRAKPAILQCDESPMQVSLAQLGALDLRQVRRTPEEALFNSLMQQHHYLGYTQPVGEHLKYLVYAQGRPVACLAWSSSPRHLGSRDRFIGWSKEARLANISWLAYNTRFSDPALGQSTPSGLPHPGSHGAHAQRRLVCPVRPPHLLPGNLHRARALSRHLLQGGQLDSHGGDHRARQSRHGPPGQSLNQASVWARVGQELSPTLVACGLGEAAQACQRHPGRA